MYSQLLSFHPEQARLRRSCCLQAWGIANSIRAMCFDTTSSNTGRIAGAFVLLEQKLEKELLSLACTCRHHIMELIIGAVFHVRMGTTTSSPEVQLFKRFKEYGDLSLLDIVKLILAD